MKDSIPSIPSTENERINPQNLWTTPEVAAFLHVSIKTVFNLRMKRGLPFVQLGGAIRFVPEEVRAYLAHSRNLSAHRLRQMFNKGVTA